MGCSTFAQITTAAGTAYINSGLAASTTYRYRVRATDAAGNLGAYSSVATATTAANGQVNVTYIQNNYANPATPQSLVGVTYMSAQTAGNLNVVVVGWNDTTSNVTSVTDSSGNVYTKAVGPTENPATLSQSIYYATNIAGAATNANVVTVKFDTPAVYPDIRVFEYSGVDPANPVDVVAVGSGTGTSSATSTVTTTAAGALLFSAGTTRTRHTGPGPGYTTRVITSPDGDIVEDQVVSVAGGYNASAPMTSGDWVMQLVVFRGA